MRLKNKMVFVLIFALFTTACSSPPKLKEPKGELFPINSSSSGVVK